MSAFRDALGSTRREVRLAMRSLLRSPGFLALSAGSLAIGIAMSVTMLGVLDATRRIPDGSQVAVDGVAGVVRWIA